MLAHGPRTTTANHRNSAAMPMSRPRTARISMPPTSAPTMTMESDPNTNISDMPMAMPRVMTYPNMWNTGTIRPTMKRMADIQKMMENPDAEILVGYHPWSRISIMDMVSENIPKVPVTSSFVPNRR